eukprot:358811-Chlamydomonas_euryale.AAC.22
MRRHQSGRARTRMFSMNSAAMFRSADASFASAISCLYVTSSWQATRRRIKKHPPFFDRDGKVGKAHQAQLQERLHKMDRPKAVHTWGTNRHSAAGPAL